MKNQRKYTFKDVEMILASKTVTVSLETNLEELSLTRTAWTPEFTTSLKTRIDNAIDNYLGLDKKKELREATALLHSIQQPAWRNLQFIKTQIEVDFGEEAAEILNSLGFTDNFKKVQKKNQEALIQLLYAFKNAMSDELKTRITDKGINPLLIDTIIGYADQMKDANINQETLKQTTKELSEEAVEEFNAIYDIIIGICKIASVFYYDDPVKKEQFTFSNIVSNMSSGED